MNSRGEERWQTATAAKTSMALKTLRYAQTRWVHHRVSLGKSKQDILFMRNITCYMNATKNLEACLV